MRRAKEGERRHQRRGGKQPSAMQARCRRRPARAKGSHRELTTIPRVFHAGTIGVAGIGDFFADEVAMENYGNRSKGGNESKAKGGPHWGPPSRPAPTRVKESAGNRTGANEPAIERRWVGAACGSYLDVSAARPELPKSMLCRAERRRWISAMILAGLLDVYAEKRQVHGTPDGAGVKTCALPACSAILRKTTSLPKPRPLAS